jgi:Tol biopolymer transport system component
LRVRQACRKSARPKKRAAAALWPLALIAAALGLAAGGSEHAGALSGLQFQRTWEGTHVWLMNPNGTHQRISPLHHYGIWSSGGARVAYASTYVGYVAKGDGSHPYRIARLPAVEFEDNCFNPVWSPNAEQLVWTTGCGNEQKNLLVESMDFTNRRRLAKGFQTLLPRWSPDGRTILFAGKAPGDKVFAFYVITPDGDKPQRIPGFTFNFKYPFNRDWDWSHDGRSIIALLGSDNFELKLLYISRSGGKARLLTPPKLNVSAFDLSPDGTRIVLEAAFGLHISEIYVMHNDGTHLRQLTHNGSEDKTPKWSPRGDKIAFMSERNKNCCADIYVMNADGSAQKNLTDSVQWEDAPSWIP